MPVTNVGKKLDARLQELASRSWLTVDEMDRLFPSAQQKAQLLELRDALAAAQKANEDAAAIWNRIAGMKDVVLSLLKKTLPLPV